MKMLMLFVTILLTSSSCTIVPKPVSPKQPSYDGGVQNSGFIGFTSSGAGMLTFHKADEYNQLVAKYGSRFVPPVKTGDGLTMTATNVVVIDQEHLVDFETMLFWKRNLR